MRRAGVEPASGRRRKRSWVGSLGLLGGVLGGSWGSWGGLWRHTENIQKTLVFQWFLQVFGCPKSVLGGSGVLLGVIFGVVGRSLALLGGSCRLWVDLGESWGGLGAVLGRSWAGLGGLGRGLGGGLGGSGRVLGI